MFQTEIFRCVYGSHLFGTALPESDCDERSIVLPTRREVLLGDASYAVHDREDQGARMLAGQEDVVIMTPQKLLGLLRRGDVTAIETLFAPPKGETHPLWQEIRTRAPALLGRNGEKFRAYGKSQMLRYAERGAGINGVRAALEILRALQAGQGNTVPPARDPVTMNALAALARDNPDVTLDWKGGGATAPAGGVPMLRISGRSCDLTAKVIDVVAIYDKAEKAVSHRALKAAGRDDGADLKGLYHSLRIVDEGIEFLRTGELRFPLANAQLYIDIRNGLLPRDNILVHFEARMWELNETMRQSSFPVEADAAGFDDLVADLHEDVVSGRYDSPAPEADTNFGQEA